MTCENCIHYDLCNALEMNGLSKVHPKQCGFFNEKSRYIELPCTVGQTVYVIYGEKVIPGTVRLIRPFISKDSLVFKGNIICQLDGFIEGTKEEAELYVVFITPYGIERVAYLSKEEAEKALAKRSNR